MSVPLEPLPLSLFSVSVAEYRLLFDKDSEQSVNMLTRHAPASLQKLTIFECCSKESGDF